ncbi:MAG: hypothetical protein J6J10_03245 [Alistipes sp.]|nr:hypothetical protein [Alistipes sp.]
MSSTAPTTIPTSVHAELVWRHSTQKRASNEAFTTYKTLTSEPSSKMNYTSSVATQALVSSPTPMPNLCSSTRTSDGSLSAPSARLTIWMN